MDLFFLEDYLRRLTSVDGKIKYRIIESGFFSNQLNYIFKGFLEALLV